MTLFLQLPHIMQGDPKYHKLQHVGFNIDTNKESIASHSHLQLLRSSATVTADLLQCKLQTTGLNEQLEVFSQHFCLLYLLPFTLNICSSSVSRETEEDTDTMIRNLRITLLLICLSCKFNFKLFDKSSTLWKHVFLINVLLFKHRLFTLQ